MDDPIQAGFAFVDRIDDDYRTDFMVFVCINIFGSSAVRRLTPMNAAIAEAEFKRFRPDPGDPTTLIPAALMLRVGIDFEVTRRAKDDVLAKAEDLKSVPGLDDQQRAAITEMAYRQQRYFADLFPHWVQIRDTSMSYVAIAEWTQGQGLQL